MLVCPVTKQPLAAPPIKLATQLKAALQAGRLQYKDGSSLKETDLDASGGDISFLTTPNQQQIYSVINDVPILIEAKQLALDFLAA